MSVKNYSDEQLFELLVKIIFHEMPRGNVSIKFISSQMSLSCSQLNRRVKEARGVTVSEFVMSLRINEAKKLLAMPYKYTIGDVARMCGFADTSHMCHVFQRRVGISPSRYMESLDTASHDLSKFIEQQVEKAERDLGI